jgi:hypothetical protein
MDLLFDQNLSAKVNVPDKDSHAKLCALSENLPTDIIGGRETKYRMAMELQRRG